MLVSLIRQFLPTRPAPIVAATGQKHLLCGNRSHTELIEAKLLVAVKLYG